MTYPKGTISKEMAEALASAVEAIPEAIRRRDELIVRALEEGGSIGVVADLTGLSRYKVQQIGNAGGWPSKERMAELRRENNRLTFEL